MGACEPDFLMLKHVKLSCIDEEKLLRKKASLRDSLELTRSVAKDVEGQLSTMKVVEVAGALLMLTSLVSDIIRDTAGETAGKRNPVLKDFLTEIYDKRTKEKWQGNRYEAQIESIRKNAAYLEQLAKRDPTGIWKMTITVHKNMLINAAGLLGHLEDSKETRLMLVEAIGKLLRNIRTLEEERERIDFYLKTGEGSAAPQRFTPAAAPVKAPFMG